MIRRVSLSLNDPSFSDADWIEQLAATIDTRLNRGAQRIVFTRETAGVLPIALREMAHRQFQGLVTLEALDMGRATIQRTELLAAGKSFETMKAAYDIKWLCENRAGSSHYDAGLMSSDAARRTARIEGPAIGCAKTRCQNAIADACLVEGCIYRFLDRKTKISEILIFGIFVSKKHHTKYCSSICL